MLVIHGLFASEVTQGGRAYLLEGPAECALVDTGAPDGGLGAGHMIEMARHGLSEVRALLLTSGDPEHAGNAAAVRALTGARIAASAETAATLREARARVLRRGVLRRAWRWPPEPVRVDDVLEPGQVLDVAGGVEVIDASAVAPGALVFHCYGPGALMLGDAARVVRGRLVPPPDRSCADPAGARRLVERLAAIPVRVLAPGHGLPTVDGRRPSRLLGAGSSRG